MTLHYKNQYFKQLRYIIIRKKIMQLIKGNYHFEHLAINPHSHLHRLI